ncbi:hypothetical protein VNO77_25030 [Canavalia gladiata]|uniref:ATP-dependent Clp protease proteolytic subunit n=1 Tax=Canavalia gladiata TaxID=3824 RepID=A0AAN9L810_CANGL
MDQSYFSNLNCLGNRQLSWVFLSFGAPLIFTPSSRIFEVVYLFSLFDLEHGEFLFEFASFVWDVWWGQGESQGVYFVRSAYDLVELKPRIFASDFVWKVFWNSNFNVIKTVCKLGEPHGFLWYRLCGGILHFPPINRPKLDVVRPASSFALNKAMLALPSSSGTITPIRAMSCSSSSVRTSLSTNFAAPLAGISSSSSLFAGHKLRPSSLNPASFRGSNSKRGVVTMVIPFKRGSAWEQPPPDLASYLYKNRIVYLGMVLVPAVSELLVAEFLHLQYDDYEKPIYLYINSTGTTKGNQKFGYETEALAIYDAMNFVKPPVFTLAVGNAWGEAALLLAAGAKGNRSALPSSKIMIRQPIARFQGQATDVNLARKEISSVKKELVNLYAKHIGKSPEQIEADIERPKYFTPSEAVEYGIIDKVLENAGGTGDFGVVSNLKKAQLI